MSNDNKKNEQINSECAPEEINGVSEFTPENDKQKELADCREQLAQWKDKFLRSSADYQNYIKRAQKERELFQQNFKESIFLDLLAVVDDCNRALNEFECSEKDEQQRAWMEGFALIAKRLFKLLEKYNIQEITQLSSFDPHLHEALSHVESDQHESGAIVQVFQKGYMIDDRVLCPAKVAVAK